jgi:hypothetical protein
MNVIQPGWWLVARRVLTIAGALIILVSLARWGGTIRPSPLFFTGVGILSVLILVFSILVVWLYHNPKTSLRSRSRSTALRRTIATLTLISITAFTVGGFWDEVWHRKYGGFGDDFFWPPHLLIYTSLLITAIFAGVGLWITLKNQGSIRDRFQAENHIGLISLVSTFLIASLPSDEIWHRIYGKDITGWSLPHIIIAGGTVTVTLIASYLMRADFSDTKIWITTSRFQFHELLSLLLIAVATVMLLQFGVAEWDAISSVPLVLLLQEDSFWRRPEWLYPVVIISIAIFTSTFALYTHRKIGVATAVAIIVLVFRLICLTIFSPDTQRLQLGYTSHFLILPAALTLDVWYFLHRHRPHNLSVLVKGNLLAGIVFLIIGLPLIDYLLVYPRITQTNIQPMIWISLVMALVSGWAGANFSDWLITLDSYTSDVAR